VKLLLVHELLGNPTLKRRQMLAHSIDSKDKVFEY